MFVTQVFGDRLLETSVVHYSVVVTIISNLVMCYIDAEPPRCASVSPHGHATALFM